MSTTEVLNESNVGVFYEALTLDSIEPSKTNPRKHFDKIDLEELAKSIREKGVIQPIVVRPLVQNIRDIPSGKCWEIVAGERRYRASKIAGVSSIPAIARNLDDRATLEVQVIENLQRADIHPLDEALGYRELIQKHGYEVDALAAKVGKSSSYIYQRLKLADLIPSAQKLFQSGTINAGHAVLIARLSADEQKDVISKDGILWHDYFNPEDPHPCSVRNLAALIRSDLYLDLARAPWKQNDTKLVSAAGACAACPKRSGANPNLFSDITEKNICTDRSCYNSKLDAFLKRAVHEGGLIQITTEYSAKPKAAGVLGRSQFEEIMYKEDRCKFSQKAIVVEGNGRGATREVCIDKNCKKHHATQNFAGSSNDYKAQEAKRRKKHQAEQERRALIFTAVMEKAPKELKRQDLELIAKAAWKRLMNETQRVVMKVHGGLEPEKSKFGFECDKPAYKFIDAATDAALVKFMIATALGPDLSVNAYAETEKPEQLLAIAKRLKVDVDKIDSTLKAKLKEKAKPKKKVQTSAKRKAGPVVIEDADPDAGEDEFMEED